jgi:hypothetical protein
MIAIIFRNLLTDSGFCISIDYLCQLADQCCAVVQFSIAEQLSELIHFFLPFLI